MDKRPQFSAKHKTDLMPKNASCVKGGTHSTFNLTSGVESRVGRPAEDRRLPRGSVCEAPDSSRMA